MFLFPQHGKILASFTIRSMIVVKLIRCHVTVPDQWRDSRVDIDGVMRLEGQRGHSNARPRG